MKKSMAQDTSIWFRKNGSHVVDRSRGFFDLTMYLRMVSSSGGLYCSKSNVSRIRAALHNEFSALSFRIRCFISLLIGGRPGLRRDFHRQYRWKPVLCHLLTVAGCIRWAQLCQLAKHLESTIHRTRKRGMNRGRGSFFSWMR